MRYTNLRLLTYFTYLLRLVDRISSVGYAKDRIQCSGPPTLLKRLIRSLSLLQTRSDWLGVAVLLTYSICPNRFRF